MNLFLCLWLVVSIPCETQALNCRELLEDEETTSVDWPELKLCISEINDDSLMRNTSANIWRLVKMSFYGSDNIPVEAYKDLGYILTAIPISELRNISMESVEIVEAFGAIRSSDENKGFSSEKIALIARKVRDEWLGKNPETYSEYDLMSLGEILCHFNISDIEAIHSDAFRIAAEWIGKIKKCPQDRLQAFAMLAKSKDAFGEPSSWSKLDVSIVGNIINGLSQADILQIGKEKLHLNRYYASQNKTGRAEVSKGEQELTSNNTKN